MEVNIKDQLADFMIANGISQRGVQLPDVMVSTDKIRVIMINETPPENTDDFFYSRAESPRYMQTTISLFQNAGINAKNIEDILRMGIYITTAVKTPKKGYAVDPIIINEHLPILEREIELFPNLRVIMLMGDVAKTTFNLISKKNMKKNSIPSGSTYKIRENEYYYGDIRVFPSYIMTGGNILIEKSKCFMISDDIRRMMELL